MVKENPIIIVGGGLSGLAAGITLQESGLEVLILEASDGVGGRVRTDTDKGFLFDRGFQVLLKSYPEAQRFLDYNALDLRSFLPGALVLNQVGENLVMDPLRNPSYLFQTLFSPIGSLADKLNLLRLKLKLNSQKFDQIFKKEESTTIAYLNSFGFSKKIIEDFFIPFLGGIFLENKLKTSSRMFEFVFKLFGAGDTSVPALGMGQISEQLAKRLGENKINLNEPVIKIENGKVQTSLKEYASPAIFFAGGNLNHFPGDLPLPLSSIKSNFQPRSAYTLYYSSKTKPSEKKIILLNSIPKNWVNTLAVMDNLSSNYAPKGFHLLSITLKDPLTEISLEIIQEKVKKEMSFWFPDSFNWKFLKAYPIKYALPDQDHVVNDLNDFLLPGYKSVYLCGDYLLNGSINGALRSGRLAAEQYLKK